MLSEIRAAQNAIAKATGIPQRPDGSLAGEPPDGTYVIPPAPGAEPVAFVVRDGKIFLGPLQSPLLPPAPPGRPAAPPPRMPDAVGTEVAGTLRKALISSEFQRDYMRDLAEALRRDGSFAAGRVDAAREILALVMAKVKDAANGLHAAEKASPGGGPWVEGERAKLQGWAGARRAVEGYINSLVEPTGGVADADADGGSG